MREYRELHYVKGYFIYRFKLERGFRLDFTHLDVDIAKVVYDSFARRLNNDSASFIQDNCRAIKFIFSFQLFKIKDRCLNLNNAPINLIESFEGAYRFILPIDSLFNLAWLDDLSSAIRPNSDIIHLYLPVLQFKAKLSLM